MMKSPLSRRRFLQVLGGTALSAGGLFGYTRLLEPHWLDVQEIPLSVPNLPHHLTGLRIAQISDIHLSEYTSADKVHDAVNRVNAADPAFVMLTGDFVGNRAKDAGGLVEPLRQISAPVYAVLGNHDLWTDREVVRRYLVESNVTLLTNQAQEVAADLYLAGVDDLWSGHPDLNTALHDVPVQSTTLLMAHEPDYFDHVLATQAPIAVQFSGHSHGGQVRIPMLVGSAVRIQAPVLPRYGRRYPIGLQEVDGRQVYTNRGLGVWPLPYRFNCRPEVSLFSLTPRVG